MYEKKDYYLRFIPLALFAIYWRNDLLFKLIRALGILDTDLFQDWEAKPMDQIMMTINHFMGFLGTMLCFAIVLAIAFSKQIRSFLKSNKRYFGIFRRVESLDYAHDRLDSRFDNVCNVISVQKKKIELLEKNLKAIVGCEENEQKQKEDLTNKFTQGV